MQSHFIRPCRDAEQSRLLEIINTAAQRYHGIIPVECWHEPYMTPAELMQEIAAGVEFWGCDAGDGLVGVMGVQKVKDVELIRHAYVWPAAQGQGIGAQLLNFLTERRTRPLLVGTWASADWAIRFYERHGFVRVVSQKASDLLQRYWAVPQRQAEASVVLAMSAPAADFSPV